MNFQFFHNSQRIYQVVVIIWLILFTSVVWQIIANDIQRAKTVFNDHAYMHYQQANERVHINHSVLDGFAAMISAADDVDSARIRIYAQQMLRQYPHIFKFEIVEKVSGNKLESFSEYYRHNFYPDFKVKAFSYESDRQWQAVERAPYHLLIVFMEPMTSQSRDVLGLDIGSNEFFSRSFYASEQQRRMVATDPFRLVQGQLAYLLQRPVSLTGVGGVSSFHKSGAQSEFVELVILADSLLDRTEHILPGMRELLYNASFDSADPMGQLYLHQDPVSGWLESRLFPRLSVSRTLESESQPFVLLVEHQLGWSIVSWWKLALALLIAIISFVVMRIYARLFSRNEMERTEVTDRLFHLANHDVLTGLANRSLLMDRLSHAITQADRQEGLLAVLFLDLDRFKAVNDLYGHDAGDSLLRHVAERLRACVRAGDTIARIGGDEFVVVLENLGDQNDVNIVVETIRNGFEQPFSVNLHSIKQGISIGVAIYPHDAAQIEALIKHADTLMFKDKRSQQLETQGQGK
ncbi:MAG: diguanylate cyclase [Gammaproteobacteria bacterium]|nr:diguanylate cyclase [Gammaproteobacteria bacterium]